jgi:hypothetical protein
MPHALAPPASGGLLIGHDAGELRRVGPLLQMVIGGSDGIVVMNCEGRVKNGGHHWLFGITGKVKPRGVGNKVG